MSVVSSLVDRFLDHHFVFRPVDATFMGIAGHDDRLPPADPEAPARQADGLANLKRALDAIPPLPFVKGDGDAIDHSILSSHLKHAARELAERSHYRDPTWYTGETAFGLITLLLPQAAAWATSDNLAARLSDIPRFLQQGRAHLKGGAVHPDWVTRARKEARAVIRLLGHGLQLHPLWRPGMANAAEKAAAALAVFDVSLADLGPADPACGADYIDFIMREVHQLPFGIEEAEARAVDRFAQLGTEIAAQARAIDPEKSWRDLLNDLDRQRVAPADLVDTYRRWHDKVMEGAAALVTPATDYALDFRPFPDWARDVYADLYFLFYRSPPPAQAGQGSVYWVAGDPISLSVVKQTHAIHHASIGHHTHNARARVAPSRLARLAETGVARGVAFLAAGTTGEGWACHAQHLTAEIPGVLNRVESDIMLRDMERRNVGALLADIRLHTGRWSLAEMRRFYAEEGGFGAGRTFNETVRNSIFPGTRVMYWLGQEMIRDARQKWTGSTASFHDALIGCGHPTMTATLATIMPPGR